jgi:hypothetical protein
MRMHAFLLLAAMAAGPAMSADTGRRDAEPAAAPRFATAPSQVALPAARGNDASPPRKPKRVRHTIPAPTRR